MTAIRFYLVRHAPAEPKGVEGDAARRLTPGGRARFAAHVRTLGTDLDVLLVATSPFARARETADVLAAATGAPVLEEEGLRPGESSGREILDLGRRLGPGSALVGHNPEIADAVARAAGRALEVSAGAVAAIDADDAGFRLAWLRAPA